MTIFVWTIMIISLLNFILYTTRFFNINYDEVEAKVGVTKSDLKVKTQDIITMVSSGMLAGWAAMLLLLQ